MHLKFKKLHPNAKLPAHATEDAAGLDLHACLDEAVILHPGEAASVPTGLAMELPRGMEAQIRPRSGLAAKHAITVLNSPGTIDADYRGEIKGLLINHSRVPFVIEPGMRICQMVVNAAYVKCRPEFVEELNETERGENGLGSTGYGVSLNSIAHPSNGEEEEINFDISDSALETFEFDDGEGDELPETVPAYEKPTPSRDDIMKALFIASKGIR